MTTPLLICDDSNMARKQCARSLPDDWPVDISFACNGIEAIEAIKQGKGDVLLLDLNMPEMDGYEVLETIVKEDLPTMVIVISGDIQPQAHKRVTSLGALDFIKKPVNKRILTDVLTKFGVIDSLPEIASPPMDIGENSTLTAPVQGSTSPVKPELQGITEDVVQQTPLAANDLLNTQQAQQVESSIYLDNDLRDCFQEIANVSMGQAGDLLARLLNAFVVLPIPNVNLIEVSELSMALNAVESGDSTSGVCQGFIGGGVSGEALLILNDSSFKDVATLMNFSGELNPTVELELLMDLSNVLIGACLNGISEQLDMPFSQGHPVVLGQHCNVPDLIANNNSRWKRTLAIEISYGIENHAIKCDLLLLFSEESLQTLQNKVSYLLD